jgi:hypothetical protein
MQMLHVRIRYGRNVFLGTNMRRFLIASVAFLATTVSSFAAEFGDLAGTYSGKTATGSPVQVVIPKSGTPSYRFMGDSVRVNSASLSGKTIKMNVGTGGGSVTLSSSGKGQMSYRYSFKGNTASATLAKH